MFLGEKLDIYKTVTDKREDTDWWGGVGGDLSGREILYTEAEMNMGSSLLSHVAGAWEAGDLDWLVTRKFTIPDCNISFLWVQSPEGWGPDGKQSRELKKW